MEGFVATASTGRNHLLCNIPFSWSHYSKYIFIRNVSATFRQAGLPLRELCVIIKNTYIFISALVMGDVLTAVNWSQIQEDGVKLDLSAHPHTFTFKSEINNFSQNEFHFSTDWKMVSVYQQQSLVKAENQYQWPSQVTMNSSNANHWVAVAPHCCECRKETTADF